MASPQEADEETKAALERRATGGFSRAPPGVEEREKESASSSDQLSIQDLVEQQLGMRKSTHSERNQECRQDLNVSQRDEDTVNESQLVARERFCSLRSAPKNQASQFSNTAGSIQARSSSAASSDSLSWPEPKGLLLPVGFLQQSRIDLGTISLGVPQNVILFLVNMTEKKRRYRIQQLHSSIGGRVPNEFETVTAEFSGQHTVAGGRVAKIQGSFLSLSPGAVEITVGLVPEDNAGGGDQNQPTVSLVAQVEPPCIIMEPCHTTNFEGLHLEAEQSSETSSASKEVTVLTKGPTLCPP